MHWNVAMYGLPGSAMIVLHADRWPNSWGAEKTEHDHMMQQFVL